MPEIKDGRLHMTFSLGPDESAHPGNSHYLGEHFKDAVAIGFKILKSSRIGDVVNPDIKGHFFKPDDLEGYHAKVAGVGREIEKKRGW